MNEVYTSKSDILSTNKISSDNNYLDIFQENIEKIKANHNIVDIKGLNWVNPYFKVSGVGRENAPLFRKFHNIIPGTSFAGEELISYFEGILKNKRGYIPMVGLVIIRRPYEHYEASGDLWLAETGVETMIAAQRAGLEEVLTIQRPTPINRRGNESRNLVLISKFEEDINKIISKTGIKNISQLKRGRNILPSWEEAVSAYQDIMFSKKNFDANQN